jgi:hypothetical protein
MDEKGFAKLAIQTMAVFAAVLAIVGCANPGPVQVAPDTYLISRTDKGGVFGNASAMKASVIADADAFARSKGKVAVPVTSKEHPMHIGSFASFDYQFRLVDPDSPEARSATMPNTPDQVSEQRTSVTMDVEQPQQQAKPDVYAELMKLDDLRKRGIITDEEFEAQKSKVLAGK